MTRVGCDVAELLQYGTGAPGEDDRRRVEKHLTGCGRCTAELRVIRRILAGADWKEDRCPAPPPPESGIEGIRRVAARVASDDGIAAQTGPLILALPPGPERWAAVMANPNLRTAAFARWLMAAADRLIDSEPGDAVPIYDLATYVADAACQRRVGSYDLCAEVWKNFAWLLCRRGDYLRAEYALDFAEEAAHQSNDRERLVAAVQLTRAIALDAQQKSAEALAAVVAARDRFAKIGDHDRYVKAREQEAAILVGMGDGDGAAAILMNIVTLDGDALTRARRFANIAYAFEVAGALWAAGEYLAKAAAIHRHLGLTFLVHRDTWALGRLVAKTGRIEEALDLMHRASEGFRAQDDADTFIRVDLDRSELEIEHGCATSATYERLRFAAEYAVEKGLLRARCRALSYLRELADRRTLAITHLHYVREFFKRCDADPSAEFIPLEQIC